MSDSFTPPKVLLVEDDSVFRMLVKRLVGEDFVIDEASSLDAARQALSSNRYECVLLDFRLPDGTGLQLLPEAILLDLPVVMMTAMGHEQLAVDAIKQGCQDYLIKDDLTRASLCRSLANAMRHMQADRQTLRCRIALQKIVTAAATKCRDTSAAIRQLSAIESDTHEPLLDRLEHLMDGLVAYARVTSISWSPEPISLTEVAREAIQDQQHLQPQAPIELISHSTLLLKSDREAVKAICRELLELAALDGAKSVTLETSTDAEEARIDVRFESKVETLKAISGQLSPQAQLNGESGGNMSIEVVRLLVEQLNGRIWLEEDPNTAQIRIKLPNVSQFSSVITG
ncbi:response regulator [Bremerella cremea]|uniref:response regulator n=1 Tax=Bremerella cremea TaxID=1031537 RepID=UPI0031F10B0E